MTLPCGMKFSGSKLVTAQTEYPQRKCATCKNVKCRTYCLCNPGEHLCKECYAVHRIVMADKWLSGILNLASKKFSRWGWFWPTISRWRSYERVNSKYRHLYSLTLSTRLNYARKTNSQEPKRDMRSKRGWIWHFTRKNIRYWAIEVLRFQQCSDALDLLSSVKYYHHGGEMVGLH